MYVVDTDPTRRTAGQYARATVTRLSLRTLVTLGVLAVATALLGGRSACRTRCFLASEVALLVSMFVISRYVLPLVERRDRGATRRGAGRRACWTHMSERGWLRDPRREPRQGQRRPHPDRPAGDLHDRDQEPPGPDAGRARCTARCCSQAQAQRKTIERVTGRRGRAADRVQPRVGGPAAGAPQGRAGRPRADAAALPRQAAGEALATRRSSGATRWSRRRCSSTTRARASAGGRRSRAPAASAGRRAGAAGASFVSHDGDLTVQRAAGVPRRASGDARVWRSRSPRSGSSRRCSPTRSHPACATRSATPRTASSTPSATCSTRDKAARIAYSLAAWRARRPWRARHDARSTHRTTPCRSGAACRRARGCRRRADAGVGAGADVGDGPLRAQAGRRVHADVRRRAG